MGNLKNQILESDDLHRVRVATAQWWGSDVFVKSLSGYELEIAEAEWSEKWAKRSGDNNRYFRAFWAVKTICDEDGRLVFDACDVERLAEKASCAIAAVFRAASRLNGLLRADVDDLLKNCEATPSGDSG